LSCAFDVINDYHLNIEKERRKDRERERKINKTP
jgi:predicted outer membrane lipoprotein